MKIDNGFDFIISSHIIDMSRILVCGSRDWNDFGKIKMTLLSCTKDDVVIHGGCRGADNIAGFIAKKMGLKVEVYKADWSTYGKGAGPIRNQQMLDEGKPDIVYAFHPDIENSLGTKDMIRRVAEKNIEYHVIT